MKHINYKQLAFVLDIKPIEALEKILSIHCKLNGIQTPPPAEKVSEYLHDLNLKGKKVRNKLPEIMEIEILSEHLGLPALNMAITDIRENYLKRPATKKYILCDLPEKLIQNTTKSGKKVTTLTLPTDLKSLLLPSIVEEIATEWRARFPKATVKL